MIFRKKSITIATDCLGTFVIKNEAFKLTRRIWVEVPDGYVAYIFVNGNPISRLEPNTKKNVAKLCGRKFLRKELLIVFVSLQSDRNIQYGLGNVSICNRRMGESYSMGATGNVTIKVVDVQRFIHTFPGMPSVATEQIKKKINPKINAVAISVLQQFFADSELSALQCNYALPEINLAMADALRTQNIFSEMGLELVSFAINSLFIFEDEICKIDGN